MHILNDNLVSTLNLLIELEEEILVKLCLCINTKDEERCLTVQCANCLLGNYYYDSEDYPLQVIKTHQSLKGSSNEP